MSDQIQETQQVEVNQTEAPQTDAAPAPKKDNWFLKLWRNKNKRNVFMLACCIVLIMLATMFGSIIQTAGWTYTVEDLRNATNTGTITLKADDKDESADYTVAGRIRSGILFTPKRASAEKQVPAVVFIHGLYNNREMQLQNAIEMVRRGYVVVVLDAASHGHNTAANNTDGAFSGIEMLNAAKYLYNMPQVDKNKIAVSGHSMGGQATRNAMSIDGIDTTDYKATVNGQTVMYKSKTDASYKAGYHMGIISAGLVQANNPNTNIGSNVIAAGVVKASSDEFFFNSTLKEPTYVPVNKDSVVGSPEKASASKPCYIGLYLKQGDKYVEQTADDKFRPNSQYYKFTTAANTAFYLQSSQAVAFTGRDAATLDDWTTVNGGIYALGQNDPVAVPTKFNKNNVPKRGALVSTQRKGEALASAEQRIRVVYEAHETHPMNHFSTVTAAHVIDFFYNAFGVSPIARYMAPANQTWWLKEAFSLLGFLGLFGLLFPVLDMLLDTRLFASLKAKEGEVTEGPILLTRPRKHVSYWLSGILTTVFGAISLKNLTAHEGWYSKLGLNSLFASSEGFIYSNVGQIAAWGMLCAMFALAVSAIIWIINRCINIFVYGDNASAHDERPFEGFRMRSWQNVLKTPILATILVGMFYLVIDVIWMGSVVDFRIWTFDLRVFDTIKIASMLKYVPYFFVFYMVTAALSQNYRVKDLPEWATIAINVFFNIFGVMVMLWFCNSYFINNGAMADSANKLFFIACYPVIPCVAIATVISRRMYTRTGNAWLAGLVNACIMTFIACANTSISGALAWTYGA